MSIPLTLSKVPDATPYVQYVANNGQTVYPYPFPITQDSDLVVVINGVAQNTDSTYSLSGQGDDTGGDVTLNSGSEAGDIVTLYRDIQIERLTQFAQNGGFSSSAFNAEFNNLYLIAQQLESAIAQCLQVPNTNNPAPTTILTPGPYAGKYLAFDQYGNPTPAALTSSGSITGAIVAALLSSVTASPPTADKVRTPSEISSSTVPVNFSYLPGNIRRQGAAVDGVTDDSAAIRSALDAVPSTGGGIFCDPPGPIMVKSVIYIPQRNSNSGTAQGTTLDFSGCVLNGNGGQIFESGTGQYSTVAKGGATNWGLGNELSTTIHNADKIIGATFTNYGGTSAPAVKLFNFLQGCKLQDLYSESLGNWIYTDRCFYLAWNGVNADCNGQPSTTPIIRLGTQVNTMTFNNVHVAGGAIGTGVGYQSDAGVLGCVMGLGAEDLTTGLQFDGEILGGTITGNYFENCGSAVQLGTLSSALVIESNYVNACTTFVTGDNWISGRLGHNHYDGSPNAVDLSGTGNLVEVWIPPRQFTAQAGANSHTNWTALPANWSVGAGCRIRYTDMIYDTSVGFTAARAALAPYSQGTEPTKQYTGSLFVATTPAIIPFCTTSISGTTLTVTTKIPFTADGYGIEFDVVAQDTGATRHVSGRTFGGTSVFRYDLDSTRTVVVSNSSGFFKFVFDGFLTSVTLVGGEIRII